MAQGGPVRRRGSGQASGAYCRSGRHLDPLPWRPRSLQQRALAGARYPAGFRWSSPCATRRHCPALPNPRAQQSSHFRHHRAGMLVLAVGQPAPAVGQSQIQAHRVERSIGPGQGGLARGAAGCLGCKHGLLAVQRSADQTVRHREAKRFREGLALGHRPGPQVEQARVRRLRTRLDQPRSLRRHLGLAPACAGPVRSCACACAAIGRCEAQKNFATLPVVQSTARQCFSEQRRGTQRS